MSGMRGRATVVLPGVVIAALAWSSGGYFPRTWGVVLLVAAIGLLAAGLLGVPLAWDRRGTLLVGGLLALLVWELLSWSWSRDPDASVLEAERTLVLAGAAGSLSSGFRLDSPRDSCSACCSAPGRRR